MATLHEKYAPQTWDDYVGQDRAKTVARRIIERKDFDRAAFWIECAGENNSGTGKTTLARLIAGQVADPLYITEVGGSEVNLDWCRRMADKCAYLPMPTKSGKTCRAFIVNEAHAMSDGAVDFILAFVYRLPPGTVLIFTTTRKAETGLFGTDDGPFYSRCVRLTLTNQGLAKSFGNRLAMIAREEGLDGGKPDEWFVKLVQRVKNNMRAALQAVWAGAALSESDTESAAA